MKRMGRCLVALSLAALLSAGITGSTLAGHGGQHVSLPCPATAGHDTAAGQVGGTLPPAVDFEDQAALVRPCGI